MQCVLNTHTLISKSIIINDILELDSSKSIKELSEMTLSELYNYYQEIQGL